MSPPEREDRGGPLVLHRDQSVLLCFHVIKNPLFQNKQKMLLITLHVEDETRYSVHREKVAESESPAFALGAVDEVKRQNQLSASTFTILADGL